MERHASSPLVYAAIGALTGARTMAGPVLLCERFECSANVRRPVPPAYLGFDVEAARQRRIQTLRTHAATFARDIRDSA